MGHFGKVFEIERMSARFPLRLDQISACTWHTPLSAQGQDQGMRHHFVSMGGFLMIFMILANVRPISMLNG
jgi:hypothetical protein